MIIHIPTLQKMRLTSQFFGIHGTYKSPSFIPSAVSPTRSPTKSWSKSLARGLPSWISWRNGSKRQQENGAGWCKLEVFELTVLHGQNWFRIRGGLATATSSSLANTYHNSSHIHILTLNSFTWHDTFPSPVVKKHPSIPPNSSLRPPHLSVSKEKTSAAGDLDLLLRRSRSRRAWEEQDYWKTKHQLLISFSPYITPSSCNTSVWLLPHVVDAVHALAFLGFSPGGGFITPSMQGSHIQS